MWLGYISRAGYNPFLTKENIVICSRAGHMAQVKAFRANDNYPWTFAKIKAVRVYGTLTM